ncbi:DUF5689 domain-containing protein [Flavobacterium soyangense]|uniref:Choice-of-anchor J domain-containing protein n=1 Tax=Flavobacterium soyangense TaxID=2023265 RepID=A0A930UCP2_9FLAO|nr:DUF5689 domain-containing protein [Flavobacterium soyangense]MBF2708969.1 choice-of-anchor J domain-containing protein [Flavobacterium soyangense]
MKNKVKNIFIGVLMVLFTSCVSDTFKAPVQDACISQGLSKTKEVANIYKMAINPVVKSPSVVPNTPIYTAEDIIEGYVISSDEGGNFYKSMYFQPLDGTKGFNLSIDETNIYTKNFQPGKKVFLKLKGLAYGNPTSFAVGLTFGAPPTEQYVVDRLSGLSYKNYLIPSCDVISEDAIVHKITLAQATSDVFLNTLVEFDNVQFTDESSSGTYDTFRNDDYDSSIYITNGINSLIVRTSRFANFAGYKVSSGKGKIRGVLTKYNSSYQIILRTERDVNMPNPRVDYILPIGGTTIKYLSTLKETFESYAVTTAGAIFPKYVNDAFFGSRYWDVKSFKSNKYIQMSSFGSGGTNKTYLAIPVAFTPGKKLSFKTKDGFYLGPVLKVYYSTNYIPNGDISKATLVDITSNFLISSGTLNGYATNFINSGSYLIPANLTGNGFFLFEYSGTSTVTTSIEIDDIIIN